MWMIVSRNDLLSSRRNTSILCQQYHKLPMFTKLTQVGSCYKGWTSTIYQRVDSGLNLTFLLMRLKSFEITCTDKFGYGNYRVGEIIIHKITIIQSVKFQSLSLRCFWHHCRIYYIMKLHSFNCLPAVATEF